MHSLLTGRGDEHPNASGVQAMVSAVDVAKRALVTLLLRVAALYSLTLGVKRDSPDSEVKRACRNLSKKTHPDRGGDKASQQDLNNAYTAWETAARDAADKVKQRNKAKQKQRYFFYSVNLKVRYFL